MHAIERTSLICQLSAALGQITAAGSIGVKSAENVVARIVELSQESMLAPEIMEPLKPNPSTDGRQADIELLAWLSKRGFELVRVCEGDDPSAEVEVQMGEGGPIRILDAGRLKAYEAVDAMIDAERAAQSAEASNISANKTRREADRHADNCREHKKKISSHLSDTVTYIVSLEKGESK